VHNSCRGQSRKIFGISKTFILPKSNYSTHITDK
jgi:hypothetical protein